MKILLLTNSLEANGLIESVADRRNEYVVLALPSDPILATAFLAIELHDNLISGSFYDLVVLVDTAQGGYACTVGEFAVPKRIVAHSIVYDVPNTLQMSQTVYPVTTNINDLKDENGNVLLMRNVEEVARLCSNYEYDLLVVGRVDELPQFNAKNTSPKSLSVVIDYLESNY